MCAQGDRSFNFQPDLLVHTKFGQRTRPRFCLVVWSFRYTVQLSAVVRCAQYKSHAAVEDITRLATEWQKRWPS